MDEHEIDDYLTRQFGITEAQWDQMATGTMNAARSARIYYNALLQQGFAPEAALKIICAHGCAPKWPWESPMAKPQDPA